MPTWPTTGNFPQAPRVNTWQRSRESNLITSKPASGPPLVRRRSTVSVLQVSFQIVLSTAQLATLDGFFENDCAEGAIKFDWVNPENGVLQQWAWVEPPSVAYLTDDHYTVTCQLRRDS